MRGLQLAEIGILGLTALALALVFLFAPMHVLARVLVAAAALAIFGFMILGVVREPRPRPSPTPDVARERGAKSLVRQEIAREVSMIGDAMAGIADYERLRKKLWKKHPGLRDDVDSMIDDAIERIKEGRR